MKKSKRVEIAAKERVRYLLWNTTKTEHCFGTWKTVLAASEAIDRNGLPRGEYVLVRMSRRGSKPWEAKVVGSFVVLPCPSCEPSHD